MRASFFCFLLSKMLYNPIMVTPVVYQVPSITKRTHIPQETIRALAEHIAAQFNPEKIILFGSHAYGIPSAWSDVDFLVIMDAPRGELETAVEISKSLPELRFGVDIIVRPKETFEKRIELGDWFLTEIREKGKVLYERTD